MFDDLIFKWEDEGEQGLFTASDYRWIKNPYNEVSFNKVMDNVMKYYNMLGLEKKTEEKKEPDFLDENEFSV